jgi:hypothetical protein
LGSGTGLEDDKGEVFLTNLSLDDLQKMRKFEVSYPLLSFLLINRRSSPHQQLFE